MKIGLRSLFVAASVAVCVCPSLRADTIYTNMPAVTNYLPSDLGPTAGVMFTPGANDTVGSVSAVLISLASGQSAMPVDFSIYSETTNIYAEPIPGTLLEDLGTVSVGSKGTYTVSTLSGLSLVAGESYFVVLSGMSKDFGWYDNGASTAETSILDSNGKWEYVTPQHMQFEVDGPAAMAATPEPASLALVMTGLCGVAAGWKRRRA